MRRRKIFVALTIVLIAICAVAVATLGLLPWTRCQFLSTDLAQTTYQAKLVNLGFLPHRDIFGHHLLSYLFPFSAIDLIIPLNGSNLKILAVFWQVVYAGTIFMFLNRVYGMSAAVMGATAALTAGWFWNWGGTTFNLQSYCLPVFVLLLLKIFDSCENGSLTSLRAAAGLLGILIALDQRFILFSTILVVPFLYRSHFISVSTLFTVFALVAGPAAIFITLVAALGGFRDLYEQLVLFPFLYRNRGLSDDPVNEAIGFLLDGFAAEWHIVLPALLAMMLCIIGDKRRYLRDILYLSAAMGMFYVLVGGRQYPHYLLIFSPIVLFLCGALPVLAARVWAPLRWPGLLVATMPCAFGLWLPLRIYFETGSFLLVPPNRVISELASFISKKSSAESRVLVWGGYAPQLYLLSDRISPIDDVSLVSITGANYLSNSGDLQGIVPSMKEKFIHVMESQPPELFIYYGRDNSAPAGVCNDGPGIRYNVDWKELPHFEYLRKMVTERYNLIKTFKADMDWAQVYRLRSLDGGSSNPG